MLKDGRKQKDAAPSGDRNLKRRKVVNGSGERRTLRGGGKSRRSAKKTRCYAYIKCGKRASGSKRGDESREKNGETGTAITTPPNKKGQRPHPWYGGRDGTTHDKANEYGGGKRMGSSPWPGGTGCGKGEKHATNKTQEFGEEEKCFFQNPSKTKEPSVGGHEYVGEGQGGEAVLTLKRVFKQGPMGTTIE